MNITPKQVREAIATAHDMCGNGDCIHVAGFGANMPLVMSEAQKAAEEGAPTGSEALAAYYEGMHVGFRLALLVMKEELENENSGS